MLYLVVRFLLRPLFHVVLRMHVTGRENVPVNGPFILASNHLSFIDSMVIPLSAPRRVHYLAKAEYFTGTGVGGWLTRTLFTALGAMPVQRQTSRAAQEALDTALAVLRRGADSGMTMLSMKDRWLLARITAPVAGTNSAPVTRVRSRSRASGRSRKRATA